MEPLSGRLSRIGSSEVKFRQPAKKGVFISQADKAEFGHCQLSTSFHKTRRTHDIRRKALNIVECRISGCTDARSFQVLFHHAMFAQTRQ